MLARSGIVLSKIYHISFRFNNNQVCKHVELHRSSLPMNSRFFFRCGLIKRRCESDPICHGLSIILYKLPDHLLIFCNICTRTQRTQIVVYIFNLIFFFILKEFLKVYRISSLMLRFVQSASFELLKFKFVCEKLMFVMMKRRKKSYRERVVF